MANILLVEDDALIYRMYDKAFRLAGDHVRVADSGQAGLDALPSFAPDIVLLDIMMPGMNGLEFLQKIKSAAQTKQIPVVVLTNISDMGVARRAVEHGASLTLVKSDLEPDQVIAWVKAVLERKTGQPSQPAADGATPRDAAPAAAAEPASQAAPPEDETGSGARTE